MDRGEASLEVSHCNQGRAIPSISTGRDLDITGLRKVSVFVIPPKVELVSLLSPSKDEISVSSTFVMKSSKYFSASSVNRLDILLLSLLLWTPQIEIYINKFTQEQYTHLKLCMSTEERTKYLSGSWWLFYHSVLRIRKQFFHNLRDISTMLLLQQ